MLESVDEDAATKCASSSPAQPSSSASAAPYAGFRVAVVGSCQVAGMASALTQLLAGAQVKFWHYGVTPGDAWEIAETVTGYDLVISQLLDPNAGCLEPQQLRERCRSLVLMPIFGFPGLHPDCVLIHDADGKLVETPLGPYNSAIALSGYALGFCEKRTKALFNAYVYDQLGYFDAFYSSKTAIVAAFRQFGYEISDQIDDWLTRVGCFMYTTNHPYGEVMWDLAVLALSRAGLHVDVRDPLFDQYLSLNAIWPVYPEIARKLGIKGGLDFTKPGFSSPASESRTFDLPHYISSSFEVYSQYDLAVLLDSSRNGVRGILNTINAASARYVR